MDQTELFDEIDRDIRQGRLGAARQRLRRLAVKKLKRAAFARCANLARRAGLPQVSIRMLNPLVRPRKILLEPARAAEVSEYAAALIDVGAVDEGLRLLASLDPKRDPQLLLFQAFGLFTRWDYASAIPLLKSYIRACDTGYQALVGKVNLAAALVTLGEAAEARPLLSELLAQTRAQGLTRLHGNGLELQAQLHFGKGEFAKARGLLAKASEALGQSGGLDEFFVKKWNAFLDMAERPIAPGDFKTLAAVKAAARKRNHWEGVRDCDFFVAKKLSDKALLTHLLFSTPHAGFQSRVRAVLENPPADYIWNLKTPLKRSPAYFDLTSGTDSRTGANLKVGQLLHRCLSTLACDFYQSFRIATLFASLYPDEHYDPETSPFRVHQALERLRKWFKANGLPLSIDEHKGFYSLSAQYSYGIRKTLTVSSALELKLMEALRTVPGPEFTAAELARRSGRPLRSVQRLIEDGLKAGLLAASGETWTRTYHWKARSVS